jgi:tryptophan-rich sensory protein
MNILNSFASNYNYQSYAELIKPVWAPPNYLFGPVWSILYTIILITFGYVFYLYYKRKIKFNIILPFILNLFFNFIFTPIQFGLKNNLLGSLDVILVWITLVWAMYKIYKYKKNIVFANIPYLAWVSFATILQITITFLNLK